MREFNIEDLDAVIAQGREGSLAQMLALQLKSQIRKAEQMAADNEKAMDSLRQADAAVKLAHEKYSAIAAENVGLNKFIKQSCYVYNGDGSDISDSYIPAHESPMMPVQSQSLLPVAAECLAIRDAFIRYLTSENLVNNPDADEQQVYDHCAKWVDAMCQTPATDRIVAEIKADGVDIIRNALIKFVEDEVGPNDVVPGLIRGAEICVSVADSLREGADK